MSYQAFIGIDISKKTFDVWIRRKDVAGHSHHKEFSNTKKGVRSFLRVLEQTIKLKASDCLFCMEHTGVYTIPLICELAHRELRFAVESPLQIKRSSGINRQKSDKADARMIALYAESNHSRVRLYNFHGEDWLKLRTLLNQREKLIKAKVSFQRTAQELKEFTPTSVNSVVLKQWRETCAHLKKQIKEVEAELRHTVKQAPELLRNFKLATSVKGIGPISAYYMLVYTQNFSSFDCPRAFACYAGTAPFEHSSGTSIHRRRKVSHMANKKIKAVLYEAAWAAITWDAQIKAYYNRMLAKGKPKLLIVNNVKNKLIARVFAVIKRQEPFVNLVH